MDKIKPYLAILKKHHFWILCGLVVVVTMTVWSLAAGEMTKKFAARRDKLKGLVDVVTKVSQQVDPPNENVVKTTKSCNARLEQEVYLAWNGRYSEQKKKNPWPVELGPEFLMVINSLPEDGEIPRMYRETYMTFIKDYFPRLFQIIDLRRTVYKVRERQGSPDAAKPAAPQPMTVAQQLGIDVDKLLGAGGGAGGIALVPPELTGALAGRPTVRVEMETVGKVEWDVGDIRRMAARFMWAAVPSSPEVRLVQEDLWVYKALLEIIRNTNGAARYKDLPVRRIEALQIGRDAADAFAKADGRLFTGGGGGAAFPGGMAGMGMPPGMAADPAMMAADPAMMMAPGGAGGPAPTPAGPAAAGGGGAVSFASQREKQLINYRYVDQKGKPLAADANPPYAEFKMMPVVMRLIVNQQKIPSLLVECANSTMPVEVSRVGFQPGQAARVALGGGGMGGMPGMGGGMPGMGGMPEAGAGMPAMDAGMMAPGGMGAPGGMPALGMPGSGAEFAGASGGSQLLSAEYVPVELLGIIYIFNPPDPKKLGTGSVGTGAASAATPGGPAAAAPGVPAAAAVPGAAAPAVPATMPAATPAAVPGAAPAAAAPATPAPAGTPAAAPAGTMPAGATPAAPAGTPAAAPAPAPAATPAAAPKAG